MAPGKPILCTLIHFLGYLLLARTDDIKSDISVIVIGAGPSGIAAATRLLDNGIKNVKVFEAEGRIGGRINSVKFGDAYVDLGAEWCNGDADNIVYSMAKQYNILKEVSWDFKMLYSDGNEIDQELAEELYNLVDEYENFDRNNSDYYTSIGDFFLQAYNQLIIEKYKNDEEKLKICLDARDTLESCICYLEGSFNWFRPALNSAYEKSPVNLNWNLRWNGTGYKAILDIMMKKYPTSNGSSEIDEAIFLNKEVSQIDWTCNSGKVSVKCTDGTIHLADHVIFTPSIGVLKDKQEVMFVPPLNKRKKDCINKFGFDAIMKVLLHFPQRWWTDDFNYRIFVWADEDKRNLAQKYTRGPIMSGKSWVADIHHVIPTENNPNVLLVWITGGMVPELEVTSDEILKDGIMFALSHFLGKTYNLTDPDKIIHSSWFTNKHFRGTYSYETPELIALDYNCHHELAKPLEVSGVKRVFFAGEATNPTHYSTVHGAIETGYREASILLNSLWEQKL